MFRKCIFTPCYREEAALGTKLPYRPGVRHKKVVLPLHRDFTKHWKQNTGVPWVDESNARYHLQHIGNRHAAPRRGEPSPARTLGFVYQYCTEICDQRFYDTEEGKALLAKYKENQKKALEEGTPAPYTPDEYVLDLWGNLEALAGNSTALGHLAVAGRASMESLLLHDAYQRFPRLRAAHLHDLIAHSCNLFTASSLGKKIDLVKTFGLETDVGLWKELNILNLRLQKARESYQRDLSKVMSGNRGERLYFWRMQIRSVQRQLHRRTPAKEEDLLPRMEWLRDHVFAFFEYVRLTRGEEHSQYLIRRLVYPHLAGLHGLPQIHPLEGVKARVMEQRDAAGGWVASDPPVEGIAEKRIQGFPLVPRILVKLVKPRNAIKEAQLILRYHRAVPEFLREGKITFEDVYTSVEDVPMDSQGVERTSTTDREKVFGVHMKVGEHLLGIGEGYSWQDATEEAALNMIQRFYFKSS